MVGLTTRDHKKPTNMCALNLITVVGSLLIIFALSGENYATGDPDMSGGSHPPVKCGKHEVFSDCIVCGFQPTCDMLPPKLLCHLCVVGCVCKPNFIRLTVGGPCICKKKCPRPTIAP